MPTCRTTLLFILILLCNVHAQTVFRGKVSDKSTGEPISFAGILLKGTTCGGLTDVDGKFYFKCLKLPDSVVIQYIGYERLALPFKIKEEWDIRLIPVKDGFSLDEVVVESGENPAHRIIRAAIKNKYKNDKNNLDAYQYEVYNKIEFDLNNISEKFKSKRAFKPFAFAFNNIDSSNKDEKHFLPMFMIENLSDVYYSKSIGQKQEIVKASKITGLEDQNITQVMGDVYQNIDLYENDILLYNKNFKSPLCDNALWHYRFYLEDSLFIQNHWCYHIRFKGRRSGELAFLGNMWIADTSFAIKRIEFKIHPDANINYIKGAYFAQEFNAIKDHWMLIKDRIVMDLNPDLGFQNKSGLGVYGRKSTTYKKFIINGKIPDSLFRSGSDVIVNNNATKQSDEFWNIHRHDSLSSNEKKIYKMVDTIQSLPAYKTWVNTITFLGTGYKGYGPVEFGEYYNLWSTNQWEGTRFKLSARTSMDFSTWTEYSGYVAYGIKDEAFKYQFAYKQFLKKLPQRRMLMLKYKNDIEILGQNQSDFAQDNLLGSFLRNNPNIVFTKAMRSEVNYFHEWRAGYSITFNFNDNHLSQVDPKSAFQQKLLNGTSTLPINTTLHASEIGFSLRLAPGEKIISDNFNPVILNARGLIVKMQYAKSITGFSDLKYDYHKVGISMQSIARIGQLSGYGNVTLAFGQTFGNVPYPLLEVHPGNQTLIFEDGCYNMMGYNEFITDRFASLWWQHHLEGLILNKVPFLKKLKWRETLGYKFLIGDLQSTRVFGILPPETYTPFNGIPYQEFSAGIENIFKFFKIDFCWRLSHLESFNTSSQRWPMGFRLGFDLVF